MCIRDRGALVVGFSEVHTAAGTVNPAKQAGLRLGDRVIRMGNTVTETKDVYKRQGLGKVLFNTLLFFATALGVGLVVHYAMKWLDQRNPHTPVSYTHLDVYKRQMSTVLTTVNTAVKPKACRKVGS